MTEILVRPWKKKDLTSIRRITWQSWISTYSVFIPQKDLRSYFNLHYTKESLVRMFEDPCVQGFVAEIDDRITGYARVFFDKNDNRFYISSLYLLPDFESRGIGNRLLKEAEAYVLNNRAAELWVGVMVKNRRALLFYRKAGFSFIKEEPFVMGRTTVSHLIGYKRLRACGMMP